MVRFKGGRPSVRRCRSGNEVGLKRVKGVEPSSSVWKTETLPLSYTRTKPELTNVTDEAALRQRRTALGLFHPVK
jgi:hypothetical protein